MVRAVKILLALAVQADQEVAVEPLLLEQWEQAVLPRLDKEILVVMAAPTMQPIVLAGAGAALARLVQVTAQERRATAATALPPQYLGHLLLMVVVAVAELIQLARELVEPAAAAMAAQIMEL